MQFTFFTWSLNKNKIYTIFPNHNMQMRLNDNLEIYSLNQPVFIFGLCKYSLFKFLALMELCFQYLGQGYIFLRKIINYSIVVYLKMLNFSELFTTFNHYSIDLGYCVFEKTMDICKCSLK